MATLLVHAGTVTKMPRVTPEAARPIVSELGLREMMGRGRFCAWGVVKLRLEVAFTIIDMEFNRTI